MSAPSLLLVRMDVAHDREATVNQMYEEEHLPPILEVPGVRRITRYRQPAPTSPRSAIVSARYSHTATPALPSAT